MQIYLDYSATTPTCPEAIALIQKVMKEEWGNPSSLHEWGNRSATVLEVARMRVADLINATPESIIFTSGGTEANNLALIGITRRYHQPQHLIISSVEHSAVAEPVKWLAQQGWQVTQLPVDHWGRVNPQDLAISLRENTVLVSIIYGQSEIGTVQPIELLGKICHDHGVLFHTDAVQVAGRLPIDVQNLPVDLLSLSSHKIYGPQGVGALYVKPGVEILPLLGGGGQEFQLRSGTQATPIIAGFGMAAHLVAQAMITEVPRLIEMRDHLFDLLADQEYLVVTGDRLHRLPHHASFCLTTKNLLPSALAGKQAKRLGTEITGRTIVRELNLAGIGISAGTACHSGQLNPSPILLAMGYTEIEALTGIRLTMGKQTTLADINWTAMVIKQIFDRIL